MTPDLAGLGADPYERQQLQEVLDEIAAEGYGDDDSDDFGPWHDQLGALAAIGDQVDDQHMAAAVTAAEDEEDAQWFATRPSGEARAARALDRVAAGTYTPPAYFRPARAATGRYASACGEPDEYGRCSARFHQTGCHVVTEEAAATGDAQAVEAWNTTLRGYTPPPGAVGAAQQMGLANEPEPLDMFADLLDTREPRGYQDLQAAMMAEMGEADPYPAPGPREPRVDTSAIRAAMGL